MALGNSEYINTHLDWRNEDQKKTVPITEIRSPIAAVKKYLTDVILKEYQQYWR
jgi:hypothetical protein